MSVKIAITHWTYDDNKEDFFCDKTKELIISDFDSNLMESIKRISDDEYIVYFDDYYGNYGSDIIRENYFPYILKNGIYEWHVPVDEVSVREFMTTHDIDDDGVITLSEDIYAGGDVSVYVSDIVHWIPILFSDIGMILTAREIYKFVTPIYHKLIGKNNKVASPYEFLDMLRTRDYWTMDTLKSRTTLDEKTIECMLIEEFNLPCALLGETRINGIRYLVRKEGRAGKGFRDVHTLECLSNGYKSPEKQIELLKMQLEYKDQEIEFLKKIVSLGQEESIQ